MKDVTPPEFACTYSVSCPAIYEDGDDYIIVGKFPSPSRLMKLQGKIGMDETAVSIPKAHIDRLVSKE